jgi:hypothetical protein
MEPAAGEAIVFLGDQEAIMSDHWLVSTERRDVTRGSTEDEAGYLAGWTISGVATLATILAVWVFAI